VIPSKTQFAFVIYRTQLFNPADMDNVKKVQAGYKVEPLSQFLGKPVPSAPSAIDFMKPLSPEDEKTVARVLQRSRLRPSVLPGEPVGDGAQDALREARIARTAHSMRRRCPRRCAKRSKTDGRCLGQVQGVQGNAA